MLGEEAHDKAPDPLFCKNVLAAPCVVGSIREWLEVAPDVMVVENVPAELGKIKVLADICNMDVVPVVDNPRVISFVPAVISNPLVLNKPLEEKLGFAVELSKLVPVPEDVKVISVEGRVLVRVM